jgi:hypothetical protein
VLVSRVSSHASVHASHATVAGCVVNVSGPHVRHGTELLRSVVRYSPTAHASHA